MLKTMQCRQCRCDTWELYKQEAWCLCTRTINVNNVAKSNIVPNPMVTGSNDDKNQSFFSDTLINDYLGFLSEQFWEDAVKTKVKHTNQRNKNSNKNESFLSDQYNDADIEPKAKQMKKKRKQKKSKNNSKADISENNTYRNEHDTIGIPQDVDSSNWRINDNEYSEFDDELSSIRDQEYHHIKIISIASDTIPCIMWSITYAWVITSYTIIILSSACSTLTTHVWQSFFFQQTIKNAFCKKKDRL